MRDKEIGSITKNFFSKINKTKRLETDGFPGEVYKTLNEELMPILPKLVQKLKRMVYNQTHLTMSAIP